MKNMLILALVAFTVTAARAGTINETDRRLVVEAVAKRLQEQYVFPEKGVAMAETLRSHLKQKKYDGLNDGKVLAKQLSADLQRVSGDLHLNVEYTEKLLPDENAPKDPEFEARERERYYGAHLNFGFNKLERLEGNIGLLELSVFAPVDMGGDTAVAAMQFLANTGALIIDLRGNGGGDGDMAKLLMSYLFDGGSKPVSGFYSRPKNELVHESTLAYVPGRRYGEGKRVYVLTSRKTFSAAEAFAYDLQALKRITVIGEATGGGAHPFEYERVHRNFVLWLVTGRSLNPITGTNWQGVGVRPDVAVPADQALERAVALARGATARSAR